MRMQESEDRMIYRCKHCKNRHDCPENKEQYEKTCDIASAFMRGIGSLPDYHSYYSWSLKCDYWYEDRETYVTTMESEGADDEN